MGISDGHTGVKREFLHLVLLTLDCCAVFLDFLQIACKYNEILGNAIIKKSQHY